MSKKSPPIVPLGQYRLRICSRAASAPAPGGEDLEVGRQEGAVQLRCDVQILLHLRVLLVEFGGEGLQLLLRALLRCHVEDRED